MSKQLLLISIIALSLVIGVLGCGGRGGMGGASDLINTEAPDFTLNDINGKSVSLAQFKGKVVLLNFWATWCPPCRREIPHLIDLNNRYQTKGLAVVGVALDEEGAKNVRPFADEYKINYPVLIGNHDAQKAYGGIQGVPTTFLIDKSGKISYVSAGYEDAEVIEKRLQSLL